MAIIYTYPTKSTVTLTDLVLITDKSSSSPKDQTKQASISSIKDAIDVVDSLNTFTGALTINSGAGVSVSNADPNITIANTGVLSVTATSPVATSGATGAITLSLGTVPVDKGGTNITSYTAGDLLYASGGTTLTKLGIGTAGQVLKTNAGATAPEWSSDIGVVTGYTNGTDNNILTSSGATTINGESNFTFDGATGALALTGQLVATANVGTNTAIRGIASNSTSTQGWNTDLGVANFDQNDTGANCTTIAVNTESTNGKLISFYYQENSGTGPKGEIKYDTGTSQVQYNVTSDYRLKENVVDLSSAVDRVKNLKPKRFNFIDNDTEIDGFLAHEVQEVVPQAVSGVKDQVFEDGQVNPQQMDASKLIPVLTAAIKELTERIEALEG